MYLTKQYLKRSLKTRKTLKKTLKYKILNLKRVYRVLDIEEVNLKFKDTSIKKFIKIQINNIQSLYRGYKASHINKKKVDKLLKKHNKKIKELIKLTDKDEVNKNIYEYLDSLTELLKKYNLPDYVRGVHLVKVPIYITTNPSIIAKDKFSNLGWQIVKLLKPGYVIDNQPIILLNRYLWQTDKKESNRLVNNLLKNMELEGDGLTKYRVVGEPITIQNKSYIGLFLMKTFCLSNLTFDILSLNVLYNQEPVNKDLSIQKLKLKREAFEYIVDEFSISIRKKIDKYTYKLKKAKIRNNPHKIKTYKLKLNKYKDRYDSIKECVRSLVLAIKI